MPRGDGTGPMGMGPMTGRAAGYCAGYAVPGFMNPYGGRGGAGMRRGAGGGGGGRGRRNWFYATGLPGWARMGWAPAWGGQMPYAAGMSGAPMAPGMMGPQMTQEQQMDFLKGQAEYLESALSGIRKQIEDLHKSVAKKDK